MIMIGNGGFIDGNNQDVRAYDAVEYRFGNRRGVLLEALQDGDAYVRFTDNGLIECVKWNYLCKIPYGKEK